MAGRAADSAADFAIVGLGRMGASLARQALEKGLRVAGFTLGGVPAELRDMGLRAADEAADLRRLLKKPRVVLLYVPAGKAVDDVVDELLPGLQRGDVIADGGNSYWGDSIRRARTLRRLGIDFLDVGTSGGVGGARHGACFMVGGREQAVARVEPILTRLAVEGGYVHAGASGAGHFTKLVHNGIEFGMLQAIGEGLDLLEAYPERLPVADVLRCWRHGSVIRSWLVDLMERAYREQRGVSAVPPLVEDTGEVNWLVGDALELEVPIPVITQAAVQLVASRDERKEWARAIAMMRHGFGGHPYGRSPELERERRESRIGGPLRGNGSPGTGGKRRRARR
jgi:6-phosphogluconate dehydrogenase